MDKVLQGKCQTFDLKLVLAQDTTCRARLGISLHPWLCRGRELCRRLGDPGQTNPPQIPRQTPLGRRDPAKERGLLSLPATGAAVATAQRFTPLCKGFAIHRERSLQAPSLAPSSCGKGRAPPYQPSQRRGTEPPSGIPERGLLQGLPSSWGGLTATRSCFNGQILTTPLGAF